MPRIAFVVSSAREIALRDDERHPTGFWAEEALRSYELFAEAGAEVVVMTPDGKAPVPDPYSLEPIFQYPDEDRDYVASVYRTFNRDPEDIRVTLHHATELDLMASRRLARRLILAGTSADEAHALISGAARIAWRQDRGLVDVMLAEHMDGGLGEAALRAAVDDLAVVGRALSEDRQSLLRSIDGFQEPAALSGLSDEQVDGFDALFAPGGHGSMVDLPEDENLSRLVSSLHGRGAPIGALCHGPAVLLSAPERYDGQWLFEGYRLTSFTNEEEHQNEIGRLGLLWYLADALQNAGAVLDDAPHAWASHVVVDRNLITGQNPYSTEATAGALLTALGLSKAPGRLRPTGRQR